MPVSSWSPTAASNTGILTGITLDGSSMNVPLLDDAFRDMAAQIAAQLGKVNFKGADIASAASTDLSTATGWYVTVTGTTGITSLGTVAAGQVFILQFASSLLLTHHATNLILPGGANVYTTGGDTAIMVSLGAGAWRCLSFFSGSAVSGGGIPTGTILDWAGAYAAAPAGWLVCGGQQISRATYAGLFAVIGGQYGIGDGSTTFNVPDLRGRVVAGKDDMGGSSAARLNTIASTTLAAVGGVQTHTLAMTEMPSHYHLQQGSFVSGIQSANHLHSYAGPTSLLTVQGGSGAGNMWTGSTQIGTGFQDTDHTHTTTISGQTSTIGTDGAHNNIQPTMVLQKIIKV